MRNKTIVFTSAIVIALLFGLAMGAGALLAEETATDSAPPLINYQGQLSDSGGQPVSGPVALQFKLYDASSGGNMIWTETHSGVSVEGGAFSVMLGSNTPLTDSMFSSSSRYLEVGVDTANGSNYTTLPRQRLASVPYAMQANVAPWSGLSGMPAGFADGSDDTGANYQHMVTVAKSGGDYTTINDAMDNISPSSSSRYLVWVAPGVYSEQVTVKPYVHLRGAGMYTTYIDSTSSGSQNDSSSATVILPANAQLSDMTVKNSATSNDGVAVFVDQGSSSTTVRNVYAKTTESSGDRHVAFYLKSGNPTLRNVKGKTSGGSIGNWAVFNSVSAPLMDGVDLTAESNSSASALRLNGGNPVIRNSSLYATNASSAYAIEGTGAGSHTVRIDHSSIDGEDFSVRLSSGNYDVYIGASRVSGNVNAFSGTIRCAQSYDESYTDLNSACN